MTCQQLAFLSIFATLAMASGLAAQSPCGDCDHSGTIQIPDALRASQLAVGLLTPATVDFESCDIDSDGRIGVLDALGIAQRAVGLSPTLNCTVATRSSVTAVLAQSPYSGDIVVDYLLTDPEGDPCGLAVEISTDGGGTFTLVATDAPGGDGRVALAAAPGGTPHVYVWDSITDLGMQATLNVVVRLTPDDGIAGTPGASAAFLVDNRVGGVVSWSIDLEPIIQSIVPMGQGCILCHEGMFPAADLDLSTYADLMAGSAGGAVVIPFDADSSRIVCKLEGQMSCGLPMPMSGTPWTTPQIQLMRDWINQGASDN